MFVRIGRLDRMCTHLFCFKKLAQMLVNSVTNYKRIMQSSSNVFKSLTDQLADLHGIPSLGILVEVITANNSKLTDTVQSL